MARCRMVINVISCPCCHRRPVSPEQICQVLQAHREGSSLRGISRTSGLAYNTVVSIVRSASQKAQLVHHQEVQSVETEEVCGDEMWSFVAKNRSSVPGRNAIRETVGLA